MFGRPTAASAWSWVRWWWRTVPLPAVQRGRCRTVCMTLPQLRVSTSPGGRGRSVSASRARCPHVRTVGVRRPRRPVLVDQRRRAGAERAAAHPGLGWRVRGPPQSCGGQPPQSTADITARGCPGGCGTGHPAASAVCFCFRNRGRVSGRLLATADTAARVTGTRRPAGVRWLGAATAGMSGRPGGRAGRGALRAPRSWLAAPRPGRPRRSAHRSAGP